MTDDKQIKPLDNLKELSTIKKSVSAEWMTYVKNTLFSSLNDGEILLVLYKAKALGLDVLNGEVTAYSANGKHGRQLVFIVGKDAKARKAIETGKVEYSSKEAIYIKKDEKGNITKVEPWEGGTLWGATATVKRKDELQPHTIKVSLSEYKQSNSQWTDKPDTMIKKVALSQALTEAFPELFAGVYDDAEINKDKGEILDVETTNDTLELDSDNLDIINSMLTLDALTDICKRIQSEKGIEYRPSIIEAYTKRREELEGK